MKQEVKPTVIAVAAIAVVVVLGLVFWRVFSPPVDASTLESRFGPQGGQVAAPPPGAMPKQGAPKGAGPMPPPGAMMPGPGAPPGAGPMPPPGAR